MLRGNYGIGERTYVAVIDIQDILEFCGFNHKFTGIAKYPAVTRDLSMVVPKHILAGQIEDVLEQRSEARSWSPISSLISEGAQIKPGIQIHGLFCYSVIMKKLWKRLKSQRP